MLLMLDAQLGGGKSHVRNLGILFSFSINCFIMAKKGMISKFDNIKIIETFSR